MATDVRPQATQINFFCRNCQSHPGKKCTQPTDTGRKTVSWFHSVRTDDLNNWNEESNGN